jgi:hypothetical protein
MKCGPWEHFGRSLWFRGGWLGALRFGAPTSEEVRQDVGHPAVGEVCIRC